MRGEEHRRAFGHTVHACTGSQWQREHTKSKTESGKTYDAKHAKCAEYTKPKYLLLIAPCYYHFPCPERKKAQSTASPTRTQRDSPNPAGGFMPQPQTAPVGQCVLHGGGQCRPLALTKAPRPVPEEPVVNLR